MNAMKKLAIFLLVLLAPTIALAQEGVTANPTRPSAADNAYLTAKGYAEIEFGASFQNNFTTLPALLKLAVSEKLEFGFAMSGILDRVSFGGESDTDVGAPGLQAKAQIYNEGSDALAVAGRIDFPRGDADPTFTFYGAASRQTSSFLIDGTAGLVLMDRSSGYGGALTGAVSVSPTLDGKIGAFGEIFGQAGSGAEIIGVDFGLSFSHSPTLVSDVALTLGLNDAAPNWVLQVGFTSTLGKIL